METIPIDLTGYNNKVLDGEAKTVPIREEPEFQTVVHFDRMNGFHLRDKTGQYIYPINGILRNMMAQVVQEMF